MAKAQAASLTISLLPTNENEAPYQHQRGMEGQKLIYTYVYTDSYLLNSYETDDVIEKSASEIDLFLMYNNQTAVQFAKALISKTSE